MNNTILVWLLTAALLQSGFLAEAQQVAKVYRIGFLDFRFRSTTTDPRLAALRQELSELGYVEGKNLVLEYRSAKGKRKRLPEVAAELVKLKVDVLVTAGSPLVWHAAKRATRTIPIVMAGGTADPVEAGVVASLARPGENITGLTSTPKNIKLPPKMPRQHDECGALRRGIVWGGSGPSFHTIFLRECQIFCWRPSFRLAVGLD